MLGVRRGSAMLLLRSGSDNYFILCGSIGCRGMGLWVSGVSLR
jgi:hypothetical protein